MKKYRVKLSLLLIIFSGLGFTSLTSSASDSSDSHSETIVTVRVTNKNEETSGLHDRDETKNNVLQNFPKTGEKKAMLGNSFLGIILIGTALRMRYKNKKNEFKGE